MAEQKARHAGGWTRNPEHSESGTDKNGKVSFSREPKTGGQNGKASFDKFDKDEKDEHAQAVQEKLAAMKKMFGRNLARIRKSAGYSQLALSVEVDLTHNFINELEQGAKGASFETLARLSAVLRVPVHQFFEPLESVPANDAFRYSDPIDQLMTELHETIDGWNDKRTK
jgi:transcriptional regulator with XRE-family HTH domain